MRALRFNRELDTPNVVIRGITFGNQTLFSIWQPPKRTDIKVHSMLRVERISFTQQVEDAVALEVS